MEESNHEEAIMSRECPEIMTLQQAAEYLQISERTIQRMLKKGEIPGTQVGGQWRFDRDQLRALVRGEWKPEPDQVQMAQRDGNVFGIDVPQAFLDLQQAARQRMKEREEEAGVEDDDEDRDD
jgi:excisionase family DNA binding protein